MLDLNNAIVRSSARNISSIAKLVPPTSRVNLEVIELKETNCIPRRDPSPRTPARVHRLSKKKATILADKDPKQEHKKKNGFSA